MWCGELKRVRWLPVIRLNFECPCRPHATARHTFDGIQFYGSLTADQRRSTAHVTEGCHALRDTKADSGERARVYAHTARPVPVPARSGDKCGENLVR